MAKITTNSSRVGDSSLSLRLNSLHQYYQNEASIWDIGCDHGLLGLSFLNYEQVQRINLVDPAAPVIETLRNKIKATYISNPKLFIHHLPGQEIKLDPNSNCIFIAGMGGKEIGEIILNLIPQLSSNDRLVISPHRKILELRELLHSKNLALLDEEVLREDGQFYQIIVLAKSEKSGQIPLYGEKLWASETGKEYRNHQLKHFDLHQDVASRQYLSFLKSLNS
ncbi:tRNA (adenine(22)-N(1))-methyltransferase TrmK [Peredibacter starrii]|uniref:tRNA (Adenine(22)-N(1))-methyltransferase TrmK n=1 Tax=Peredibacter starrii TaxID=28202 RepID=A0AAX4HJM2_9BACT|nr:tRNA (adenine(22)-N(1))-methyltransferase TrmK [Peredibacter starrii]WPU63405.1 tRNA (adenine(22)-N(1))-methyltransferase TrmK [Peredibacter starrii]